MGDPLRPVMTRLLSAYRAGSRLALLFDYDGTLTPIVAHPSLAVLPPDTRRLLARLARLPRLAVGVVSGRCLQELRGLVGLEGAYYAGTGGLELDLAGRILTPPGVKEGERSAAWAAERLRGVAARYPGAWVEDKRLGVTLHYREVPLLQAEALQADARQVLAGAADRVRVVEGPKALEVTASLGWDKGTAVRRIVEAARSDVPLFAGDGDNDREAFDAVTALGGEAIGVGPSAPASVRYRLPGPEALIDFLTTLCDRLAAAAPRAGEGESVAAAPR